MYKTKSIQSYVFAVGYLQDLYELTFEAHAVFATAVHQTRLDARFFVGRARLELCARLGALRTSSAARRLCRGVCVSEFEIAVSCMRTMRDCALARPMSFANSLGSEFACPGRAYICGSGGFSGSE